VQSHLNVDQWVMARDRHRLNRLRKDKKTETAEIEKLFEQSNA
jgi:ATP-dependent helicase HrpA